MLLFYKRRSTQLTLEKIADQSKILSSKPLTHVKNQQDHKKFKNMHVLYHSLKKILSLEAGTTPTVVGAQRL